MARILKEYTGKDPRVKNVPIPENIGIAENTNAALAAAAGNFVGFMDHDDLLAPDALFEIAIRLEKDPSIDAFYTDEDKVSADGTHFFEPHLKPDFAPDSLRSGNYICHITAASRALMNAVGGLRPGFDGSQDHDLALRLSENAAKITHIPRILYHWRMLDTSFSHQKAQTVCGCRRTRRGGSAPPPAHGCRRDGGRAARPHSVENAADANRLPPLGRGRCAEAADAVHPRPRFVSGQ